MDVISAIRARRSIRKYEPRPLPGDVLADLLDAARLAPSANNLQKWQLIVVTDSRLKKKLATVSGGQDFVAGCSAYLVGVTEPGAPYSTVDMTIALDHLSLRAVELGLGTCWVGDFEPEKIKDVLGIPGGHEVPICMTVGYPAQVPSARRRKNLSDLFHKDGWGGSLE